eukprot:GHVU01115872.1.p4 GENE.GHVU01115872.1~~GHVU01115872.1.p4  ORF type:complete len:109 (+),score=12.19 GHVU01115872.1:1065-1391(+)
MCFNNIGKNGLDNLASSVDNTNGHLKRFVDIVDTNADRAFVQVAGVREDLNSHIKNVRGDLNHAKLEVNAHIGGARKDLNSHVKNIRGDLNAQIGGARKDALELGTIW